jgi:hypothetical protein
MPCVIWPLTMNAFPATHQNPVKPRRAMNLGARTIGHEPSLSVLHWLPLSRRSWSGDGHLYMKHTVFLLLGLACLPHAVQANQTPASVCVEALEQLKTLQTAAPVYKRTGDQERQYLDDADRPVEVARQKNIVVGSCSAEPEIKPAARTPKDDLLRLRKRLAERCAYVDLSNVGLVHWLPVA